MLTDHETCTAPGTGQIEVTRSAGRSIVARAYATSPLRLLTPRNHGDAAWIYAASYGGGLLGGDRVAMSVRVESGACAFLSTQASTKIYRSDRPAALELSATIGPSAQLVVWPDPVVCFAGSSYRQRQQFDVDGTGGLVLVDWMTSGRRGSGERWRFTRYDSRLTIRVDGRLVLLDALALDAGDGDLRSRMGRFDVVGAAALVGAAVRGPIDEILTRISAIPFERRPDLLLSVAPLANMGCIVRVAGRSVQDVARVLGHNLAFVSALLGDDPWARKW